MLFLGGKKDNIYFAQKILAMKATMSKQENAKGDEQLILLGKGPEHSSATTTNTIIVIIFDTNVYRVKIFNYMYHVHA